MSPADPSRVLPLASTARRPWVFDDDACHVRVWGTTTTFPLARASAPLTVGADAACTVALADPRGLLRPQHAQIEHRGDRWVIHDLIERNTLAVDEAPCSAAVLEPGACVTLGGVRLVVEGARLVALRAYLHRWLGYGPHRRVAVERALRLIRRALYQRQPLGLVAWEPAPTLAEALHRRVCGPASPFVLCDPRDRNRDASVRCTRNHANAIEALAAAHDGTLCLWANRLPGAFERVLDALDAPTTRMLLVLCGRHRVPAVEALRSAIEVPSIADRGAERAQIVDDYVAEVARERALDPSWLPPAERAWIIESLLSHAEIEKTVRRFLAILEAGSISEAAAHLGMAHPSLHAWYRRRTSPPGAPPRRTGRLAGAVEVVVAPQASRPATVAPLAAEGAEREPR